MTVSDKNHVVTIAVEQFINCFGLLMGSCLMRMHCWESSLFSFLSFEGGLWGFYDCITV